MTKFKVGDKVRIKVSTGANSEAWKVGDETFVSDISSVEGYYVGGQEAGALTEPTNLFWGSELELIEQKEEQNLKPEAPRKKVKRKQVDKVLRAAQKANDIYADPQSDYEDYANACDDLHKILEKIAND